MSRLSQRIAALERQTAQRRGEARCATCREWPSQRMIVNEINADGVETRHDELEEPVGCPRCGWSPTVHAVTLIEVRDWETVGRHGRI
jgi:hypothetical protein